MLAKSSSTNSTLMTLNVLSSTIVPTPSSADPYSTKASGGFWLELSSPCGSRKLPICFATKKATHTSGSTADSETWNMIGANHNGLKKEVSPILHQLEVSLNRPKWYARKITLPALPPSKRAIPLLSATLSGTPSLVWVSPMRPFFPDKTQGTHRYWAELTYWDPKHHKGDWMTKELAPK